ncbi:MAG: hypothetical protein A2Y33_00935 [Spirochaetes bacterium GWF1_51_8]|nr:MAG: hypothetical protein A2Y33_00935 [Spirochaetes bacterium GWF1_51_8]
MKRSIIIASFFLIISFISAQELIPPSKYEQTVINPKDESSKVPALKKTVDQMKSAVKKKDVSSLKKLCSANLKWSFGDDSGIDGFLDTYKLLDNPESAGFWKTMDLLLSGGGKLDSGKKTYTVPYWAAVPMIPKDLGQSDDNYSMFYIAAGKDIAVYQEPSLKSTVIAKLSFESVYVQEWTDNNPDADQGAGIWKKVRLSGGHDGYLLGHYLYGPFEYKAVFEKVGGVWMMTAFVAGYHY